MPRWIRPIEEVSAALAGAVPELPALSEAAAGAGIYVVGGTVRDLLLGRGRTDLDVVVVGDAGEVARRLGGEVTEHERFATATVRLGAARIDLASARAETYAQPGALPDVRPAGITEDLARRDFTVNAMALSLAERPELLDPHGGRGDLAAGVLRVLHEGSFIDDPTRALRGARYAARFELEPDQRTAELLAAADLATVTEDRRRAELLRLAAEPAASLALTLLARWGVMEVADGAPMLAERVAELMAAPPWSAFADRDGAIARVAEGDTGGAATLAAAAPRRTSEAVALAGRHSPEEIAIARAMGAAWLDSYLEEWRGVALEIAGADLMAAGIPEGPAIGEGLAAALQRKLDGEIQGREAELRAALEAARR